MSILRSVHKEINPHLFSFAEFLGKFLSDWVSSIRNQWSVESSDLAGCLS
jgi:hypothetical protein